MTWGMPLYNDLGVDIRTKAELAGIVPYVMNATPLWQIPDNYHVDSVYRPMIKIELALSTTKNGAGIELRRGMSNARVVPERDPWNTVEIQSRYYAAP